MKKCTSFAIVSYKIQTWAGNPAECVLLEKRAGHPKRTQASSQSFDGTCACATLLKRIIPELLFFIPWTWKKMSFVLNYKPFIPLLI